VRFDNSYFRVVEWNDLVGVDPVRNVAVSPGVAIKAWIGKSAVEVFENRVAGGLCRCVGFDAIDQFGEFAAALRRCLITTSVNAQARLEEAMESDRTFGKEITSST
jgi:hypothetical protein